MNQSATIPAVDGEFWRAVPGYEGLYSVSNRGRVMSLPRSPNGNAWRTPQAGPLWPPRLRAALA